MAILARLRFRYSGLLLSLLTVSPVSIHGQAAGVTSQIPDAPQVSLMVLARQSATVMPNSVGQTATTQAEKAAPGQYPRLTQSDAEQLAGHARQTCTEREVVASISARDDIRAVDAGGHHDRRDRIRVPLRVGRAELELPAVQDGRAHARCQVGVTRKHVLETFLIEHAQ